MLDYVELKSAFEELELLHRPVIVHASLKPFGYIQGGADTVLRAMLASFDNGIIMPTHTYKTMITPKVGPPNNGMEYDKETDTKVIAAESFHPDMPADKMMGALAETFRNHPSARRTSHPILSFAGIKSEAMLNTETLFEPLGPIRAMAAGNGWVVLINVDHTVNTSIHYGEKLAGRHQFVRWALVGNRVVECPNFPGDSMGFQSIEEYIGADTRRVEMGEAFIQAVPLKRLLEVVQEMINKDPLALLCEREDCERCNVVRVLHPVG